MHVSTSITVAFGLFRIAYARSIVYSNVEDNGVTEISNTVKSSETSPHNQRRWPLWQPKERDEYQPSNDEPSVTVATINEGGDTITRLKVDSVESQNKVLKGVEKFLHNKNVDSLLQSLEGIIGGNTTPAEAGTGTSDAKSMASGSSKGRSNLTETSTRPNKALGTAASNTKPASTPGSSCPCSCLCGNGLMAGSSLKTTNSSSTSSPGKLVKGKGVVSESGQCYCSCLCASASFAESTSVRSNDTTESTSIMDSSGAGKPSTDAATSKSGSSQNTTSAANSNSSQEPSTGQSSPSDLSEPSIITETPSGQNSSSSSTSGQTSASSANSNPGQQPSAGQASPPSLFEPSIIAETPSGQNSASQPAPENGTSGGSAGAQSGTETAAEASAEARIDPNSISSYSLTSSLNLGSLPPSP
ncbi:hypothetical protein Golomagni_05093 [Golovinomyces magnicellulatus]|nr:hypothetical protein Golomagni_05093 [Golovinomyces magnicellulatus]